MRAYRDIMARARNLERFPFESATMAEAGRMAAQHLREAARDLGCSTTLGSAILAICESEETDAVKVRRIYRLAAQESALPHMHTIPPVSVRDDETCTRIDAALTKAGHDVTILRELPKGGDV